MTIATTSQDFFEQKYLQDSDPWDFASSAYEQGRYEAIFRALNHRRYQQAFEPGCSVGVLTARLATICEHVDAMDISRTAVQHARDRCSSLSNVDIFCGTLPKQIPGKQCDLVVLSEIGYYFQEQEFAKLAEQLVGQLAPSGTFLAAHWLGESPDHILSGDRVHEILATLPRLTLDHTERHIGYRLDRWIKS